MIDGRRAFPRPLALGIVGCAREVTMSAVESAQPRGTEIERGAPSERVSIRVIIYNNLGMLRIEIIGAPNHY